MHQASKPKKKQAGWVSGGRLVLGGVITRTTRGDADDKKDHVGYLFLGRDVLDNHPIMGRTTDLVGDATTDDETEIYDLIDQNNLYTLDRERASRTYDTEPDVFFFNFAGRSGQFVLPSNTLNSNETINIYADIRTIPHSNLKIAIDEMDEDGIKSWSITDEQGVQFIFEADEIQHETQSTIQGNEYVSEGWTILDNKISWYLTTITLPGTSEQIRLSYTDQYEVKYYSRSSGIRMGIDDPYSGSSFFSGGTNTHNTFSHHLVRRLKSIESDTHILHFNSTPDRYDAPKQELRNQPSYSNYRSSTDFSNKLILTKQEYRLNSIEMYKKLASDDSVKLKEWRFNTGYFNNEASFQLGHTQTVNEPDLFKRLKLNSVDVLDVNGSVANTYSFTYNESTLEFEYYDANQEQMIGSSGVYITLPPYLEPVKSWNPHYYYTGAFDHWGYFNGVFDNNIFNIPNYNAPFLDSIYQQIPGPNAVDRQPNEAAAKLGMLTRITYPTGGYTDFEYELNRYDAVGWKQHTEQNAGGLRIKKIESYSDPNSEPVIKRYSYTEDYINGGNQSSGVLVSEPVYLDQYFEGDFGSGGGLEGDISTYGYSSSSLIPLGSTLGGIVGYKEVIVGSGENNEFGYEVSKFSSPELQENSDTLHTAIFINESNHQSQYQGQTVSVWEFDKLFRQDHFTTFDTQDLYTDHFSRMKWGFGYRSVMDSRRGKLLSKEIYNSNKQLLQKTTRGYQNTMDHEAEDSDSHVRIKGLSVSNLKYYNHSVILGPASFSATYAIIYEHISSSHYLVADTTYIYKPGSLSNRMMTVNRYEYDNDYLQTTEKVERNSNDDERVTQYAYAHEEYSGMKTKNMLTQPYSATIKDGSGQVQSKTWTLWKDWGGGQWLPEDYWSWKGGSDTDTSAPSNPGGSETIKTADITEYDEYGNPLQVEDALGTLTKYYYGNNSQPFSNNTSGIEGIEGIYLTGIQKVQGSSNCNNCGTRPGSGDDLFTEARYDELGRLIAIIDENEQINGFGYDDFGRLDHQISSAGGVTTFDYRYSAVENGGVFDPQDPNSVTQRVARTGVPFEMVAGHRELAYFDGNNDYVNLGDIDAMDNASEFTISLWFYRQADHSGTSNDTNHGINNVLVAQSSNTSNDNLEIGTEGSNIEVYLDTENGLDGTRTYNAGIVDKTWYHLTLTYTDYGYTKLYINGSLVKEWWEWHSYMDSSGSSPLSIGLARPGVERWGDFEGYIADTRIFDRELSASEVAEFYNGMESVSYLDGLGREIQAQQRGGNNSIVTGTLYNDRGLPETVSRPIEVSSQTTFLNNLFEGTSGSFNPESPLGLGNNSPVEAYYDNLGLGADTDFAFSYTKYEASPLNRPVLNTLPGDDHRYGQGNETITSYGLNSTETFNINGNTWGANELQKVITTDPDDKKTITYTDGWGQTIASGVDMNKDDRLTRSSSDLVTEFAYDLRGNLVKVEHPRGLETTYIYNALGQLVEKKLPDQDYSEEYKYDKEGRLRFTQQPNHKDLGGASDLSTNLYVGDYDFEKTLHVTGPGELTLDIQASDLWFDDYNYTIEKTGWPTGQVLVDETFSPDGGSAIHTIEVEAGTYKLVGEAVASEPGLTIDGTFSFDAYEYYSYIKYDELDRVTEEGVYSGVTSFEAANPDNQTFPTSYNQETVKYYYDGDQSFPGIIDGANTKGRISKVEYRDLSTPTASWGNTWYEYNSQGLVSKLVQDLPGLTGLHIVDYTYDELGRTTQVKYEEIAEGAHFYQRYSYDALGRLAKVETSTNGTYWQTEAEYTGYFADGQIKTLLLGNTPAQTMNYTYTVQGWLDQINNPSSMGSDDFASDLYYENNGNIRRQRWTQSGISTSIYNYYYNYDNANRLKSACYGSSSPCGGGAFDVLYNYDKNGNITNIDRSNQHGLYSDDVGNLELQILSSNNKINTVFDMENSNYLEFTYDANGNIKTNELQGITNVAYDWRNLPSQLSKGSTTLQYAYDGNGARVKKEVAGGTKTHYVRDAHGQTIAVYENGNLQFVNIIDPSGDLIGTYDGSQRRYFLKDHLGSVRTTVDQNGNVDGYDDYYPFGMVMPERSSTTAGNDHNYKFTGHERDDEASLTLDYMGARYYDPVVPRFMSIDPAHELYPGVSAYAYVMNNPVNAIDPDGRTLYYVNGELVYDDGEDNALVVHTTQDIIDSFTEDGETDWGGVRNADGTTTEITDQVKYDEWKNGIITDIYEAFDEAVKISADNKGNISYQTSSQAIWGMVGEAAVSMVGGYVLGKGLSMLVKTGGGGFKLMFGRNSNQSYHAFRHLHSTGADGVKVMDAIAKDLKPRYNSLPVNQGKRFTVTVDGKTYQYSAFKNAKGEVNVGTIFEN